MIVRFLAVMIALLGFFILNPLIVSSQHKMAGQNRYLDFKGPYFGQEPPGLTAEVFMDGVISTREGAEMNAGFSGSGREFYYCALNRGSWAIYKTRDIGINLK